MPIAPHATLTSTLPARARVPVRLSALLIGACLVAVVAAYGYFRIFAQMASYDDEGYVMQSVRSYLDGHRLYDDVFSQYGPAFFLLQRLLHGFFRLPLTHDVVRLVTLALWLGAALSAAGVVLRLTQSFVLAAIVFVHVVVHLGPLVNEPGHPQTLLGFIVALTVLSAAAPGGAMTRAHAAACGVLAGLAVLTKINVGAFLFLGVVIPLALGTFTGRAMRWAMLAIATSVPFLVVRDHLDARTANLAIIGAVGAAAVVIACCRLLHPPAVSKRALFVFLGAFVGSAGFVILTVLWMGTSPRALLDAVIAQPQRLASVFLMPVEISRSAVVIAALGLPVAVAFTSPAVLRSSWSSALVFSMKVAFAVGTLYASTIGYVAMLAYVTPFLWIVLLPGVNETSSAGRVARAVLAATATFECLQAYPVGGSQVPFATMLIAPAGFVCLYDAMALVARRTRASGAVMILLQTIALVWGLASYNPLMGPAVWRQYRLVYLTNQPLRLPGATRIRLPPHDVARLHWLTATLAAHCTSFVTLPGFQYLHFWTGIRPLTAKNAGTWMTLLSSTDQERLWAAVDAADTPCAVLHRQQAINWIAGQPLEHLPSFQNLLSRFQTIAELDGYELMVRKKPDGVPPRAPMMELVAGRQRFVRNGSSLPIASSFFYGQPESTIRIRVHSIRRGVIVGCQLGEYAVTPSVRALPLVYLGSSGKLYGQYLTPIHGVQSTGGAVNDGRWHQVVLVRSQDKQTLYVDGQRASTLASAIEDGGVRYCQVGIGLSTGWPDASAGWMAFDGEIETFGVERRAWTQEDVTRDWAAKPVGR